MNGTTADAVAFEKFYDLEPKYYSLSIYEVIFWCIMFGLVALFAIVGNSVVIFIILRRWGLCNAVNHFTLSLAVGNLFAGLLVAPFKFHSALFQVWYLPNILCHLVPFTEMLAQSVAIFTLAGGAVNRFLFVFVPHRHPKMTPYSVRFIVIIIWMASISCSVPYGMFHHVIETPIYGGPDFTGNIRQCRAPAISENWWWNISSVTYLATTTIQLFVLIYVVDGTYALIAVKILIGPQFNEQRRRSSVRSQQIPVSKASELQITKMLIIVALMFTLSWIPLKTYLLLSDFRPQINDWYYINVLYCLAMSSLCWNPIIYGVFNKNFRKEYKILYERICCCRSYTFVELIDDSDKKMCMRSDLTKRNI